MKQKTTLFLALALITVMVANAALFELSPEQLDAVSSSWSGDEISDDEIIKNQINYPARYNLFNSK